MKNIPPFVGFILKIVLHAFFWVCVYFFYTYFLGYGSNNVTYVNSFSLFLMPSTIIVCYLFLYYLIPNYLHNKKYGYFILYSIYTFIIATCFIILSILYGFVFLESENGISPIPLTKKIPFIVIGVYMVVLFVISIGLVVYNYFSVIKTDNLKTKFLQTQLQLKEQELKFLKMQIHPHFLFNTLNTLYGFALKKSEKAPKMILKLSSLLDYILYQVDKPSVLLEDEINHIEDYISLEEIRFQDSLQVTFQKELLQDNLKLPPMLLLPFVENSFKHGVQINDVLKVTIHLKTDAESLSFKIVNSSKKNEVSKPGIGSQNIKKRLEMLYEGRYELDTLQEENEFKVNLKIYFKNE